jgi:hypothetical protein
MGISGEQNANAVLTCGSSCGENSARTGAAGRTLTVGNVKEFRTEWDALNHIQSLKTNINKNRDFSALMKFEDVVGHYRQTELLAENKTEKTKTTYLVYLRKWMLPTWGAEYLHNIKAVDVE